MKLTDRFLEFERLLFLMGELWDILFGIKIEYMLNPEKILPMSAENYVCSAGKTLDGFYIQGVHYFGRDKDGFRKVVPREAEVVVEYRSSIITVPGFLFVDFYFDRYGVALVPRQH